MSRNFGDGVAQPFGVSGCGSPAIDGVSERAAELANIALAIFQTQIAEGSSYCSWVGSGGRLLSLDLEGQRGRPEQARGYQSQPDLILNCRPVCMHRGAP